MMLRLPEVSVGILRCGPEVGELRMDELPSMHTWLSSMLYAL